jgi:asparagine synthase (glutamine-hydrolysing)
MSEVPFGVLLSGGLDSSIISAVAQKYVEKNPGMPRLHSFSIGLEGSPDLAAAKVVADFIKTKHHSYVFTIDEGLNAYRDVIYHLETYDVTTIRAATPMFLMSRKIKTLGIKMVLSGEGADEVFGGYLYFHKCPNKEEMQSELVRKVKGLYKFDCLRANKSTMAFGLEARVPFLDKEFLDYSMNEIDPTDKLCGVSSKGGKLIEKAILREAFRGYLPEEVLWRQKEQFSDGVGYSWIDSIKDRAAERVSDHEMSVAKFRFPHNTPLTKEAYFIRQTFESFYPGRACAECVPGGPSVACSSATALKWDASFLKFADCSGRSIAGVHASAYDNTHREGAMKTVVSEQDVDAADVTFCTQIAPTGEPAAKKTKL